MAQQLITSYTKLKKEEGGLSQVDGQQQRRATQGGSVCFRPRRCVRWVSLKVLLATSLPVNFFATVV